MCGSPVNEGGNGLGAGVGGLRRGWKEEEGRASDVCGSPVNEGGNGLGTGVGGT